MRIMIINPNSNEEFSKRIQACADAYTKGAYETFVGTTQGAPLFIDTYEDRAQAADGMMKLVRRYEKEVDGFIIACHCDPNIEAIKEMTDKVVVGIGEASMKLATMLGDRFSVVCTNAKSKSIKESIIHKYNLEGSLASVRYSKEAKEDMDIEEKLLLASKEAVAYDSADVIVLGITGFEGLDKKIQDEVKVPVLDGLSCALMIAAGMIHMKAM